MSKTLIFDGDCSLCLWLSERLGHLGLADADHRRAQHTYDGTTALELEAAGIRNEMLVRDDESGELRAGMMGFLWLLEDKHPWLTGLLRLPPLRWLLVVGYRTIAFNRRVLAPPARGVVCACNPDPHGGYRALLWLSVLAAGALVAWCLARAATATLGAHPRATLVLFALTWPAALLLARVASGLPVRKLVEQTSLAFVLGSLSSLPFLWLVPVAPGGIALPLFVLGLVVGLLMFCRSALRRVVGMG